MIVPCRHDRTARIASTCVRFVLALGVVVALDPPRSHGDAAPPAASAQVAARGARLVDAIDALQREGLTIVYSSAVVSETMLVTVDPGAGPPRARLERLLAPHGLRGADGPGESVLIVRAGPPIGTIVGRVVDARDRAPIGTAEVRLEATGVVVAVAPDGSFSLPGVPAGVHRLAIDARGFESATLTRVGVDRDGTREVEIALRAQPPFVIELTVTPGRYSLIRDEPSTRRSLDGESALLAPAIGGDVSRAVGRLPGVAAQDGSAALSIRGSAAGDVSYVLDGLELYDPYHLRAFHSPFSLIDTNVVDRIDVLGGGFTAELGDRHGGFVEISTVAPDTRPAGEIEAGMQNSRLSARGLTRGGRAWLVSTRAWYPDAFRASTQLGRTEPLDPRFGDLYAKLGFTAGGRHRLSVHGLVSYDRVSFVETGEELNERVDARTRQGSFWARAQSAWSAALDSHTVVSAGWIDRVRDGISSERDGTTVDDDRTVGFVGVRHDLRWRHSERRLVKFGFDLRRLDARYRYTALVAEEPDESIDARLNPAGTSLGVYAAYRLQASPAIAVELGARWDRQTYTNDNQLGPRINAIWRPGPRTELRVAAGRFTQSQRIHELQIEDGETVFGRAEISEQAELSFRRGLGAGLRLRVDVYARRLGDLRPRFENPFEPIELFPETVQHRLRILPDEARLRGVELMLRGRDERPLFWWVGYTRSAAEDRVDGSWVPRAWDQPHAGTFLIGHRRERRWSVALGGSWRSGWPHTPALAVADPQPDGSVEYEAEPGARHGDRFPNYLRLDLRAQRRIDLPRGRLRLTLELINLTDRDNPCCVDEFSFDPRPDGGADVRSLYDAWLGLTPSFSAAWEY